jgi:hypothetical protein
MQNLEEYFRKTLGTESEEGERRVRKWLVRARRRCN